MAPILYVEDDENDFFLLRLGFDKARVRAPLKWVSSAEAAINYLAGKDQFRDREMHPLPQLVVSDLNLPGKCGIEVVRWLRQQPEFQTLPAIMFSSSRLERDVRAAYAAGANAYLVKPCNLESLVATAGVIRDFWLNYNCTPSNWPQRFIADFRSLVAC